MCLLAYNFIADSSANSIIGFSAFSLSSAEILSWVGMISDTVRIVAADFFKYRASGYNANASISAARHSYFFTIAGLSFSIMIHQLSGVLSCRQRRHLRVFKFGD